MATMMMNSNTKWKADMIGCKNLKNAGMMSVSVGVHTR